jgi:hypothetical protein
MNAAGTIDEASIASLKVTVIGPPVDTPVAPFGGVVEITVGGVLSGAVCVVNVQVVLWAMLFDERSFTPVVIVAV